MLTPASQATRQCRGTGVMMSAAPDGSPAVPATWSDRRGPPICFCKAAVPLFTKQLQWLGSIKLDLRRDRGPRYTPVVRLSDSTAVPSSSSPMIRRNMALNSSSVVGSPRSTHCSSGTSQGLRLLPLPCPNQSSQSQSQKRPTGMRGAYQI